jgi:hypothetical protein
MLKRIWQKSTLSYAVETGGRVCELQIVRVGITAFRAYLDSSPLDPELRIPRLFFSAATLPLPDGSALKVSAWGAWGWSVKKNGVALACTSKKRFIAQVALVLGALVVLGIGAALLAWFNRPEWQRANPPAWVYLGTSSGTSGSTRWFLNTKALRKDPKRQGVMALIRGQAVAPGEPERADIPKKDEATAVQNFTCDRGREGYDISARLYTFDEQVPTAIPPDSDLPKGVAWSALVDVRAGTIIADAREAACYLAEYR